MPRREATVLAEILQYLRRLSGSRWHKRHGSVYGIVGQPDIYGCYHGALVCIEVKRPGERPTERQLYELDQWAAAGAIAVWADSVQEVAAMLRPYLTEVDRRVAP